MIIKVRQRHIKEAGNSYNGFTCPIARATEEQTGWETLVTHDCLRVNGIHYHVPRSVHRFLNAIDEGRPIRPFNFKLQGYLSEPAKN